MINKCVVYTSDCVDPHTNLATEDALLQSLPENTAILFLWQNRHTVVIGAGQNAWGECDTKRLEAEGGTLARRSTGGGAVYHDLGNLNFSFIVPRADYDVARQLSVVLRAVKSLGIDAEATGRNDLTAGGCKFSGNAFRLLKTSALHHGTLLVNVDMKILPRYLIVDPEKLRMKGVKSVPARVKNLSELGDVTVEKLKAAMIRAFFAEYGEGPRAPVEAAGLNGLAETIERYRSWAWNYGRSPGGEWRAERRFPWGRVQLSGSAKDGFLRDARVFTDAMDETLAPRLEGALEGAAFGGEALAARAKAIGEADVAAWLTEIL